MFKCFFWNKKWALKAYGGAALLLLLVCVQVVLSVFMNWWWKEAIHLYQNGLAIGSEGLDQSLSLFIKVFLIIAGFIASAPYCTKLGRKYQFWWREAMTMFFLPYWEFIKRVESTSQRIHEDVRDLPDKFVYLALLIVRSISTLCAFIPILWQSSKLVDINFNLIIYQPAMKLVEGTDIYIHYFPGSLCWLYLMLGFLAIEFSRFLGRPISFLDNEKRNLEGEFRKKLDIGEGLAKKFEITECTEIFFGIRANFNKLVNNLWRYDTWVHFFDLFILFLSWWYLSAGTFTGAYALDTVMQTTDALGKMYSCGFGIAVQNWPLIQQFKNDCLRIHAFDKIVKKRQWEEPAFSKEEENEKEEHRIRGKLLPFR